MIIAALLFDQGLCRDDPHRLLRMTIREILYWYDLGVAWRAKVEEQRARAETLARSSMRRFQR